MVNVSTTLEKTIDAKKDKAGDTVAAKVFSATLLNDGTKVPSGSVLIGHVDSITPSTNKSDSTVVVTFDKLQVRNGGEFAIKATVVSVTSMTPTFGSDGKSYDPSSYRTGTQGDNKSNGTNNQNSISTSPHSIDGLTLTSSPKDSTSGTMTQAKKNVHLSSGVQLIISVAVLPASATSQ